MRFLGQRKQGGHGPQVGVDYESGRVIDLGLPRDWMSGKAPLHDFSENLLL